MSIIKQINTKISRVEAEIALLYRNMIWNKGCPSCANKENYIKYNTISPETGKWNYTYHCTICGKEI